MGIYTFHEKDQNIYDALCRAIKAGKKEVSIPGLAEQENLMALYKCAMGTENSAVYNPCTFQTVMSVLGSRIILEKMFGENCREEEHEFQAKVQEVVCEIQRIAKTDSYEKMKLAYRYLLDTVSYVNTGMVEEHSAWGALINKSAVCEGISYAYAILLEAMLLECVVVSGTAKHFGVSTWENHSWNIVRLNGKCYHVDVTWGLNRKSDACFDYFMLSDEEIKIDHRWNNYFIPPCNSYQYNYFVLIDAYAVSKEHCKKIIREYLSGDSGHIYLKVAEKVEKEFGERELVQMTEEQLRQLRKNVSSMKYSYNERLRIFSLHFC